jgi:hypothetical protein
MSTTKPSNWWGVLGNLGLLLGLVLVGYQIMQTNDLARADMISQGVNAGLTLDLAVVGERGAETLAKVNHSSDDLTDEDIAILANIHRAYIGIAMRQVIMRENGMSGYPESTHAQDFAFLMNSAFGRMYWDEVKDFLAFPDSFISEVDKSLDALDPNSSRTDVYRRELEIRQQ